MSNYPLQFCVSCGKAITGQEKRRIQAELSRIRDEYPVECLYVFAEIRRVKGADKMFDAICSNCIKEAEKKVKIKDV